MGKLGIRVNVDNSRVNSPTIKIKKLNITISPNSHITSMEQLKDELLRIGPVIKNDLDVNVSDNVSVTESVLATRGNLQMTKITNNPTKKELEIIQEARGNRPYNSISDVRINHDENGNITSIQWNEN